MINYQYITYQDQLYIVDRLIKRDSIKQMDAELLKRWSRCDVILQRENDLYFCKLVPDAEIISDN